MICHNLERLAILENKTLVVDWIGSPIILGCHIELPQEVLQANARRGECDIKAFNYLKLGSLCIFSTDGDYVPLGILQSTLNPVVLYRYTTTLPSSEKNNKRKRVTSKYEFVNVQLLSEYVHTELHEFADAPSAFASMVAMTGCDFTLNLPRLGPAKIWSLRLFFRDFTAETTALSLAVIIMQMYVSLFRNKISGRNRSISFKDATSEIDVLEKAYDYVKECIASLPSPVSWSKERIVAHAKNTGWTLCYWTHLHNFPCPTEVSQDLNSKYGFKLDAQGKTIFEAITK